MCDTDEPRPASTPRTTTGSDRPSGRQTLKEQARLADVSYRTQKRIERVCKTAPPMLIEAIRDGRVTARAAEDALGVDPEILSRSA